MTEWRRGTVWWRCHSVLARGMPRVGRWNVRVHGDAPRVCNKCFVQVELQRQHGHDRDRNAPLAVRVALLPDGGRRRQVRARCLLRQPGASPRRAAGVDNRLRRHHSPHDCPVDSQPAAAGILLRRRHRTGAAAAAAAAAASLPDAGKPRRPDTLDGRLLGGACVRASACVSACVRPCVCACVCACVRAYMCVLHGDTAALWVDTCRWQPFRRLPCR